ncbi:MAG: hypothetical protein JWR87_3218 [Segetibacter sp.]|jgi:hypothetical protein|nr:hypothetical protein [Segetibacter sp.]
MAGGVNDVSEKFQVKNINIARHLKQGDMENQLREKRVKSYSVMRSVLDYTMGILYLAAATFLFFAEKFGFEMENFDLTFRYMFGGICALYGAWRIYRGVKKDYY